MSLSWFLLLRSTPVSPPPTSFFQFHRWRLIFDELIRVLLKFTNGCNNDDIYYLLRHIRFEKFYFALLMFSVWIFISLLNGNSGPFRVWNSQQIQFLILILRIYDFLRNSKKKKIRHNFFCDVPVTLFIFTFQILWNL